MNEDSSRTLGFTGDLIRHPNLKSKTTRSQRLPARLTQRRLFETGIVGWQNQPSGRLDATKIQYYITVNPTTHNWKLKGVKEITAKQNN